MAAGKRKSSRSCQPVEISAHLLLTAQHSTQAVSTDLHQPCSIRWPVSVLGRTPTLSRLSEIISNSALFKYSIPCSAQSHDPGLWTHRYQAPPWYTTAHSLPVIALGYLRSMFAKCSMGFSLCMDGKPKCKGLSSSSSVCAQSVSYMRGLIKDVLSTINSISKMLVVENFAETIGGLFDDVVKGSTKFLLSMDQKEARALCAMLIIQDYIFN